jgi:hypothetical protein
VCFILRGEGRLYLGGHLFSFSSSASREDSRSERGGYMGARAGSGGIQTGGRGRRNRRGGCLPPRHESIGAGSSFMEEESLFFFFWWGKVGGLCVACAALRAMVVVCGTREGSAGVGREGEALSFGLRSWQRGGGPDVCAQRSGGWVWASMYALTSAMISCR